MWIGNFVFLLVLNVPLVRYWLSVFKIPYKVLFLAILFFCCIGTYSINNEGPDDVFINCGVWCAGLSVHAAGDGPLTADAGHPWPHAGRELAAPCRCRAVALKCSSTAPSAAR